MKRAKKIKRYFWKIYGVTTTETGAKIVMTALIKAGVKT